jgi:sugar phosphate isomerase/epimerase
MVESPLDGLELVARDMALLHLSDTDDKVWGHNRIGTGVVDFAAVTDKVKKIGYAGLTIMEIVDRRTPDESNRVSLQRLQALGWTT